MQCRTTVEHPPFGGGGLTFWLKNASNGPSTRSSCVTQRQKHHETRPATGTGQALHTAAVPAGNGTHQRQAQPHAPFFLAGARQTEKRLEHLLALRSGHARSTVVNGDACTPHASVVCLSQLKGHSRLGIRVVRCGMQRSQRA